MLVRLSDRHLTEYFIFTGNNDSSQKQAPYKYLNAGVLVAGRYEETKKGVPQGGPLSPLLSNIMLNELDKELT